MGKQEKHEIVLAVRLSASGLGFAVFEAPGMPVDWGTRRPLIRTIRAYERFVEAVITSYQPEVLVLERPAEGSAPKATELHTKLMGLGKIKGIRTVEYTRDNVEAFFSRFGSTSKFRISRTIAEWIPALRTQLPRYRHPWLSEPHSAAAFDAIALAVTHYFLSE